MRILGFANSSGPIVTLEKIAMYSRIVRINVPWFHRNGTVLMALKGGGEIAIYI